MTSPIQTFKDNVRPAKLVLQVYSLLDTNDHIESEGELVNTLREIVQASVDEELLLVYNEIFLGLVREGAEIPRATLRRGTLAHLLRQAVVASCTGLDTYLPTLLRMNLPIVIRAVGRDFFPRDDRGINEYFQDLSFSLDETLRLLDDPNASDYISNKIFGKINFSYLSSRKGIHIAGRLLGLPHPWEQISSKLEREGSELKKVLDATVTRRNDIIHRADRSQDNPNGDPQEITFAWAKQSVDTIEHICLALDILVAERVAELQAMINAG